MNHRPLGYEPNELPDCSTPHFYPNVTITAGQSVWARNPRGAPKSNGTSGVYTPATGSAAAAEFIASDGFGNSHAGVPHANFHRLPATPRAHRDHARRTSEPCRASTMAFGGVHNQVEHHLAYLARIADHRRKILMRQQPPAIAWQSFRGGRHRVVLEKGYDQRLIAQAGEGNKGFGQIPCRQRIGLARPHLTASCGETPSSARPARTRS